MQIHTTETLEDTSVTALAAEILALESETFEITDYSDASEVMLGSSTSCSSTSTCSSTTSTTSCSA
ncbi:putative lantibiotic precursor [Catenulispora acidiphila DSM 44928]|uniref:Putative lantibiotic n=1 Tax=Catenulispora acidiphila (strain DSM 44928 / JCM 14897 / NBRC 102108 / NRRL B-24433 / ID139908) TaxID=479433 RepID=C7QBY0_CATAD|nr:thiazolylpeptide-type bacteriocin [Catenulispora acidiphila]ACU72599.1 putative lantibiotic precursor [Catenulispora acidiphila DSM 44928]